MLESVIKHFNQNNNNNLNVDHLNQHDNSKVKMPADSGLFVEFCRVPCDLVFPDLHLTHNLSAWVALFLHVAKKMHSPCLHLANNLSADLHNGACFGTIGCSQLGGSKCCRGG